MPEPAHPFVGRIEELVRLDGALGELDAGRTQAIEIVGAAGIGKTRTLAEFAARADARGHIVLTGSGADLDRDRPFGVVVDALDDYVASVEPRRLANLPQDVGAELAHVFPALSGLGGETTRVQVELYRTNRAIRELLGRLAATRPVVLLLDDFHWADPASIDLIASLLHRPPDAAVLLLIALRANHAPPRLFSAVARALRDGELVRIELAPLSRPEAAAMLGCEPADAKVALLHQESGGNPFYLEQLARAEHQPIGGASESVLSVAEVRVPGMVVAALQEELAGLSATGKRVLEGASVAGDPFEPELAAAACDVSEPQAMGSLDELLSADLVRTTDVPRRFRLRHPIVRRAVYEATPAGWRIAAHERVAQALAERGASAAARAHHLDLSAKVGQADAVATLTEAGHEAAQRAPATAARWFSGALRLLPDTAPVEQRVELLLACAAASAATGRFTEAHDALTASLRLVPREAIETRVRLVATLAQVEHLLGLHDQAHTHLADALEELPEASGAPAVTLMLELAADEIYRLDYHAGQRWAGQAAEAARAVNDPVLTAAALATLARASAWGGQPGRGEEVWEQVAPMVDALSDTQLATRLNVAVDLASAEIYLDRFAEAAIHAQRALDVGRATGQGQLFPGLYATLGVALCMGGQLTAAAELLESAIESGRLSGYQPALAWALFCRAFVALPAGDNKAAIAAAQESLDLATDASQDVIAARASSVLALAWLDAGKPERAAALAGPAGEHFAAIPDVWRAYLLEVMTRSWLALGRKDEAQAAAAGARASADVVGLRSASASAHRATAGVALAAGDYTAAVDAASLASELSTAVAMPVEAALAQTIVGRGLAGLDERDRAVRELTQAAAEFDRCGAVRYRDAAERELRQLGQHIHRRTRPGAAVNGVESLTEREMEIAQLIVDRKTNGEIASELFLSKKTVETHIRNMFHKLDASSRVDVARTVEEANRAAVRPR